jgi:hypothetical protein
MGEWIIALGNTNLIVYETGPQDCVPYALLFRAPPAVVEFFVYAWTFFTLTL